MWPGGKTPPIPAHNPTLPRSLFQGLAANTHLSDLHLDLSGCEVGRGGAGSQRGRGFSRGGGAPPTPSPCGHLSSSARRGPGCCGNCWGGVSAVGSLDLSDNGEVGSSPCVGVAGGAWDPTHHLTPPIGPFLASACRFRRRFADAGAGAGEEQGSEVALAGQELQRQGPLGWVESEEARRDAGGQSCVRGGPPRP